jgi:hypothetical protein
VGAAGQSGVGLRRGAWDQGGTGQRRKAI